MHRHAHSRCSSHPRSRKRARGPPRASAADRCRGMTNSARGRRGGRPRPCRPPVRCLPTSPPQWRRARHQPDGWRSLREPGAQAAASRGRPVALPTEATVDCPSVRAGRGPGADACSRKCGGRVPTEARYPLRTFLSSLKFAARTLGARSRGTRKDMALGVGGGLPANRVAAIAAFSLSAAAIYFYFRRRRTLPRAHKTFTESEVGPSVAANISVAKAAEAHAVAARGVATVRRSALRKAGPPGSHGGAPSKAASAEERCGPPPLGAVISLAKETGASRKVARAALVEHGHDFEAAKAALLPADSAATAPTVGASRGIKGIFEPVATFAGGKPGWCYKRGPLGLGYYCEASAPPAVQQGG